jgi:hypothetical protein
MEGEVSVMAFQQSLCSTFGFPSTKYKIFSSQQEAEKYAAANPGSRLFKPTNTRFTVVTDVTLFLHMYAEHARDVTGLELYQMVRTDPSERLLRFYVDYEVYVDPAAADAAQESRWLQEIIRELQTRLSRVPVVQVTSESKAAANRTRVDDEIKQLVFAVADRASRLVNVKGEDKVKYSYHIVFPNVLFETAAGMKEFLPPLQGVDLNVYNNKQALGMPWSGKPSYNSPYVQRVPWNLAKFDGEGWEDPKARVEWLNSMMLEVPISRANSLLESKTSILIQAAADTTAAAAASGLPENASAGQQQPQHNADDIPCRTAKPVVRQAERTRAHATAGANSAQDRVLCYLYLLDAKSFHRATSFPTWTEVIRGVSTIFGQDDEGISLLLQWSGNSPRHKNDKAAETKLRQLYVSSNGSYGLLSLLKWIREDKIVPEAVLSGSRMGETGAMSDSLNSTSDWTAYLRLNNVAFQQAVLTKKTTPHHFDGSTIKIVEQAFRERWPRGPPNRHSSSLINIDDESDDHDDDDNKEEELVSNTITASNWKKWKKEYLQAERYIEEYIEFFHKKVTGEAGKPEVFTFSYEFIYAGVGVDGTRIITRVVRRTYEQVSQACIAWSFSLEHCGDNQPSAKAKGERGGRARKKSKAATLHNPMDWFLKRSL